jgi:zeta-carotene desaturase
MSCSPPSTLHSPRSVLVLGGGLSGLSAACALADAGVRVTLVEKRPFVGGRVFSFRHPRIPGEIDNCQHVITRACTAFLDFIRRIGGGADLHLQERLSIPFVDPATGVSVLEASELPMPLHLAPSFLRFKPLGMADKVRIAGALLAMMRMTPEEREAWETQSFKRWLDGMDQTEAAVRMFWEPLVLAVCNARVALVSAAQALWVFQEAFLRSPRAGDMGWPRVGLTTLFADRAVAYLRARGGEVLTGQTALGLIVEADRVTGAFGRDGRHWKADAVITALPPRAMIDLIPGVWKTNGFFVPATKLEMTSIVGVHLWYDRPVAPWDFCACLNSEIQWVFNKSRINRPPDKSGRGPVNSAFEYLNIVLSDGDKYIPVGKEEMQAKFDGEMRRLFPAAGNANLVHCVVVKESEATFRPAPGIRSSRLPAETPIKGLVLAGEWTDTGWPSTMEGAVRSGARAAEVVLRQL